MTSDPTNPFQDRSEIMRVITADPNGWPKKPGVPMNPDVDGWHWIAMLPKTGAQAAYWCGETRLQRWHAFTARGVWTIEDASRWRYLGPCLTPQEVAARIAEARNKALEEAAAVAEGNVYRTHYRTWPWWINPDGSQGNHIVQHCDKIATAIRALKEKTT